MNMNPAVRVKRTAAAIARPAPVFVVAGRRRSDTPSLELLDAPVAPRRPETARRPLMPVRARASSLDRRIRARSQLMPESFSRLVATTVALVRRSSRRRAARVLMMSCRGTGIREA